jgi:signal transduction histidine kinase
MSQQLSAFLENHREEIMRRFEARLRLGHGAEDALRSELRDGLPAYLEVLAHAIRASASQVDGVALASEALASEHGGQRLRLGFDPGSVVREYGFLHDCILELAAEQNCSLRGPEARELADRINLASSQAVAHYVRLRDEQLRQQEVRHLSFLAHELRDPLNAAQLAAGVLTHQHEVGRSRASQALHKSLDRLRELIDSALTSGLLEGDGIEYAPLSLTELIAEAMAESDIYAQSKDLRLILAVEEGLTMDGDARLLRSAVTNLVRNAIKFTSSGIVEIRAATHGAMARVEVEDCCGGLPAGKVETLFQPFVQIGDNRSGFGLGLSITRQAILAHGGQVFVRDLPGKGCVFGFEVPLMAASKVPPS